MSGDEHFDKAEQFIAAGYFDRAQVHALLALADYADNIARQISRLSEPA